jgi:hypothetical protein
MAEKQSLKYLIEKKKSVWLRKRGGGEGLLWLRADPLE